MPPAIEAGNSSVLPLPAMEPQRALDLAVAGLSLLLVAPLLPLIALAIRLDSPGRALFVQERLGRQRIPFRCLKFRTMRADAPSTGWTVSDDVRITRVGRILRRAHLDELPQLWNVLRGDMAIVGPRPLRYEAALALDILDHPRWSVRPGLTGWAQVRNGSPTTADEQLAKCEVDAEYVRQRSFRLDLQIMFLTLGVLFRMRGL